MKTEVMLFCLVCAMSVTRTGAQEMFPTLTDYNVDDEKIEIRVRGGQSQNYRVVHLEESPSTHGPWSFAGSSSFIPPFRHATVESELADEVSTTFFRVVPRNQLARSPDGDFANVTGFDYQTHYFHAGTEKIRLAFIDEGVGDPVVFLHGVNSWSYSWSSYIKPVMDLGRRVICVDMPGFGKSDNPTVLSEYRKGSYQRWLDELIFEYLGLTDVVLVGASFTADIAARLAVDNCSKVNGLVAICPTFHDGSDESMNQIFKFDTNQIRGALGATTADIVDFQVNGRLSQKDRNAYSAPHRSRELKEGILAPSGSLEPDSNDHPSAQNQREYWEKFSNYQKPLVVIETTHHVQVY